MITNTSFDPGLTKTRNLSGQRKGSYTRYIGKEGVVENLEHPIFEILNNGEE